MNIEMTSLKKFKWKANDNGNNDDYCSYYARDCVYLIDEGASSLITEDALTKRFIEKSMRVLKWKEEKSREKLTWKLVKDRDGNYRIECCDVDYLDDWEGYSSTLAVLDFTTENVFHII
jgi:hypothetical protein